MIIGVVKESAPGETRVAATPATVAQLLKLGYDVVVEPGAGAASRFPDEAYVEAGRQRSATPSTADIVLGVNAPSAEQLDRLKPGRDAGQPAEPGAEPGPGRGPGAPADHGAGDGCGAADLAGAVAGRAVSSMANIAGYRAVVEAAHVFGRFFTGQVTAAGKVPPAKVLVVGAGVAGLAAIGAAGQHGRDRARDRPAARGGRPGAVAGWGVPLGRGAPRSRSPRPATPRRWARTTRPARPQLYAEQCRGRRHHHHHRADPGPPGAAADHRRDGGLDEAGQRDRGHGRGQRRQRRGHGRRRGGGDRQRRDDHRLHRPGRPAAGAGLPALRHQPGQPDEADDARARTASWSWTSTTSCSGR